MKILAVAALALASASCASVRFTPRLGQLDIDGHIGVADATTGVTSTNDLGTIGLDDDSGVVGARFDAQAGGGHVTLQLSSSAHGGTGVATATLDDGSGNMITVGDPVDSDFDLTMGEATVTWDLAPGDALEIGIGVGATVFDLDARFTDLATSDSIDVQQAVPIPVLALRAGFDFGAVDVSALLGAMDVDIDGNQASFYDLDLMARMQIFGSAGKVLGDIVLGFRRVDMQVEFEDATEAVDAEMILSGPYIGLSLGF